MYKRTIMKKALCAAFCAVFAFAPIKTSPAGELAAFAEAASGAPAGGYEHDDINDGYLLRIGAQNIDASSDDGDRTAAAGLTWLYLEHRDVAVKFKEDVPFVVLNDYAGKNFVRIAPYDVADGIAYFSYKDVEEEWKFQSTIDNIYVDTEGVTDVEKVALIRATGEIGGVVDEWYRFSVDLSGAKNSDILVLTFSRNPGLAGEEAGAQFWYLVGTKAVYQTYTRVVGEDGKFTVRVPLSVIPSFPTQAGAVSMDCMDAMLEYELVPGDTPGDADCDGEVKMNDAVLIMQSLSNPDKYGSGEGADCITEQGLANADVIGGDGVTPLDASTIQKYLLKLVPELPVK